MRTAIDAIAVIGEGRHGGACVRVARGEKERYYHLDRPAHSLCRLVDVLEAGIFRGMWRVYPTVSTVGWIARRQRKAVPTIHARSSANE